MPQEKNALLAIASTVTTMEAGKMSKVTAKALLSLVACSGPAIS
jgi:hypothetical protein